MNNEKENLYSKGRLVDVLSAIFALGFINFLFYFARIFLQNTDEGLDPIFDSGFFNFSNLIKLINLIGIIFIVNSLLFDMIKIDFIGDKKILLLKKRFRKGKIIHIEDISKITIKKIENYNSFAWSLLININEKETKILNTNNKNLINNIGNKISITTKIPISRINKT